MPVNVLVLVTHTSCPILNQTSSGTKLMINISPNAFDFVFIQKDVIFSFISVDFLTRFL